MKHSLADISRGIVNGSVPSVTAYWFVLEQISSVKAITILPFWFDVKRISALFSIIS